MSMHPRLAPYLTVDEPGLEGQVGAMNTFSEKPAVVWQRALQNVAPLDRDGSASLASHLAVLAEQHGSRPALVSDECTLSYTELARRHNQYGQWALAQSIAHGEAVALLAYNSADYPAIWLGISGAGAVVALINTNLTGEALLHSLTVAAARHIIVDEVLAPQVEALGARLPADVRVWVLNAQTAGHHVCVLDPEQYSGDALAPQTGRTVAARDTALLIFTSGTTGRPKAARVSHYRILEWSFWFAGMMNTTPADRLYNCLPLYHSTGGVVGIGAVLVRGGAVVIRKRFSARSFWDDVIGEQCTLFLYIGELCRFLTSAPTYPVERQHKLRLCCGNGLRPDIWTLFQQRFAIPHILEFYASTEGNVSLYNVEGQVGSIGRFPFFLAHRFAVALIMCDPETGEPLRDGGGLCVPCEPGTAGEAIGRIGDAGSRHFEGYTDSSATQSKILRDVFAPGDAWYRTGDLMRKDKAGFFYFVDRMGDTFRWKGENVSTAQVADCIGACPGVTAVVVYGVSVPGTEGRAGMAAITVDNSFDLAVLFSAVAAGLPIYARPVFVRICNTLESTGTFKPVKAKLVAEGFDPEQVADPVYIASTANFQPIDRGVYAQIEQGKLRL